MRCRRFHGRADRHPTCRHAGPRGARTRSVPRRGAGLCAGRRRVTIVNERSITHCENMRFRFAVIDAATRTRTMPTSLDPRTSIDDTKYAAFYYPWIVISDPRTGARKLMSRRAATCSASTRAPTPSAACSRRRRTRSSRGALDLEYRHQRRHPGRAQPARRQRHPPVSGPRHPGVGRAHAVTSNALWKYVSVRRLFIFLERSIYEGTQWVVFEPNDDAAVGAGQGHDPPVPAHAVARGRAVRRAPRTRRSSSPATARR